MQCCNLIDPHTYHHRANLRQSTKCCTIDWYSKWPKQALLSVSNKFQGELAMNDDVNGYVKRAM